ncbi:MAG: sulfatase-like hydrolase/transferase, partial [Prolixibacteraceae bacterium]|nr:sulfatase-like hydrolase/transferase [Prolixibacteraceae bacterium]
GYYNHPYVTTPVWDDMAANGIRFDRFYATSSMCSPTRAALLTGRNNMRMGISSAMAEDQGHVPVEEITFAEICKEQGYATGHFGKWHVGGMPSSASPEHIMHHGMAGFEEWFSTRNVVHTYNPYNWSDDKYPQSELYWHNGVNLKKETNHNNMPDSLKGDDSRIIMDQTMRWINKSVRKNKPFCAFVNFHAMHRPLENIPQFEGLYSDFGLEKNVRIYMTNLSAIDHQMGRLRDTLKALGVAENTMIWFFSDNGPNNNGELRDESPGFPVSHGQFKSSKGHLYEGGIRVPGILEWPAKVAQSRIETFPVNTFDIFPTICDVLDVELPNRPIDGISLLPLINGSLTDTVRQKGMPFATKGWRCWMEQYKVVAQKSSDIFELYDIINDPYETKDLSPNLPEIKSSLINKYLDFEKSYIQSELGKDYIQSSNDIIQKDSNLKIFPNPVQNELIIKTGSNFNWRLLSYTGTVLLSGQSQGSEKINMSMFPAGIYVIKINLNGVSKKNVILKTDR